MKVKFSASLLIAGCGLACFPPTSISAVYTCVQADGRKTYTDSRVEAEAKGCKEIDIRPNDGSQRPVLRQKSAAAEDPPRGSTVKAPPRMEAIDWENPPINLVPGKPTVAVSPDELYAVLSKSVYEIMSQPKGSFRASYGSAIAVTSRHALTNCHVVGSASNDLILIRMDGGKLPAKLVGAQPRMDRCVVESASATLVPVVGVRSFASLREGERLYAIGNPQGLQRTISDGLLSGKRVEKEMRLIQTTAPISRGSSGGGLFDSAGNLVGITTAALMRSQNINIAIPAEDYWTKPRTSQSSLASDVRVCADDANTPDERITACTRVIESRGLTRTIPAANFYNRGTAWWLKRDYERAIADYSEAVRLDPRYAVGYYARGNAWRKKGDDVRALADYNEAIRLQPNAAHHNALAWLLATARGDNARNSARAILLARQACEMTEWKVPEYIDTLAAAYAEGKQFAEAVRWQEKALAYPEFVKSHGKEAQERLALYRASKPYRE